MKQKILLIAFSLTLSSIFTQAQIISTVAGTGTSGFSGDGGQATLANLQSVAGITLDKTGNIYVVCGTRIRKIYTNGMITTIAGTGTAGADGDGGQATLATLSMPTGIALDESGNLYIADQFANRVRKIATDGVITTIAGTGAAGFSGDGGQATLAELNKPIGVDVDGSGNIYISEAGNYRVRKINPNGIISTFAGNGTAGFSGDGGLATAANISLTCYTTADKNGNVYICDASNNRIRKVGTDGKINTIAGTSTGGYSGDGGLATAAKLSGPRGLRYDECGNLYFTDNGNYRIRKIDPNGIISTIVGDGTAGSSGDGGNPLLAKMSNVKFVAIDGNGSIYMTDDGLKKIRKVTNVVSVSTIANTAKSVTKNQSPTNTLYATDCSNLIATVGALGVSPISGSTTAKVWIETTQPTQHVKRHYEITPAANANTATGKVTLYFIQQEFTDFNALNIIKLPIDATDAANNKANLLIEKRAGVSGDGTGLPGTYTGTITTINPANADIIWNATASRWEVSFDVTGFSGFFVKTQLTTLPLKLVSFTGNKQNDKNYLQWQTTNEINTKSFTIERSYTGNNFTNIGTVNALANRNGNYNYTDANKFETVVYYRLKMIENDGKFSYSSIIKLSNHSGSTLSIYPNLVRDKATLQVNNTLLNTTATLVDATGATIKTMVIKNSVEILDMSGMPGGLYMLKMANGETKKLIKQ
jgi:Secretion system C-terminal sorting domain